MKMKIVLSLFLILFGASAASAELRILARASDAGNPMFGDKENQVFINIGQGFNTTWMIEPPVNPVPFNMFQFQYSQPTAIFRLPARISANFIQTLGYGTRYEHQYRGEWHWDDFSNQIGIISADVLLAWTDKWYFGTGLGTGVQATANNRVGTLFLIGLKMFVGYEIAEDWRAELFMQHFSNGGTDYRNSSYNFWGLGIGYNF